MQWKGACNAVGMSRGQCGSLVVCGRRGVKVRTDTTQRRSKAWSNLIWQHIIFCATTSLSKGACQRRGFSNRYTGELGLGVVGGVGGLAERRRQHMTLQARSTFKLRGLKSAKTSHLGRGSTNKACLAIDVCRTRSPSPFIENNDHPLLRWRKNQAIFFLKFSGEFVKNNGKCKNPKWKNWRIGPNSQTAKLVH